MRNAEECLSLPGLYYLVPWEFHWPNVFVYAFFLLWFKYNDILGIYQDDFFLVVNNELCFSFFATGLTKHARQVLDHRAVSQAHCYQILSQHRWTLHILSSNALSACDKIRGRLIFFLLNSPLSFLSPDFLGSCRQLDSSGKCREFICL